MRPERNPLDLNNLPDDYTRDGKQVVLEEASSSPGCGKKKSGAKDGKDEREKVYECRFCSLKFCKSQALGGHMNRHRQERETETLNRARQLVFSKDNLVARGTAHHLSGQPIPHGCYRQTGNNGDPMLPFRSIYPTRLISGASSTLLPPSSPPPPQPYMYPLPFSSYPSHSINDYVVGHALPGSTSNQYAHAMPDTNYTCIGAPVGHVLAPGNGGGRGSDVAASGGTGGGRDMSLHGQEEGGMSWGRSYASGTQQFLDPSLINQFQDGF